MSYARFGWEGSDVYVYLDIGGYLICCACRRGERQKDALFPDSFHAESTDEMVAHLREHIAAGDLVPEDVIPRLEEERQENDDFIAAGGRDGG